MPRLPYRLILISTKEGAVWYARYTDPRTGRRNKFSTHVGADEDKGRAHTVAAAKLAEIKEGYSKCPRLEQYAADFFKWGVCPWIKRQHAKGRDFGEYQARTRRAHLENYILPQFGKRRLDELTQPMIEKWLESLPLAGQTKNHLLYSLRIMMREAKRDRLIRENPLQEPEPFKKNHQVRDALGMDELRLLFPRTQKGLLNVWRTQKYAALFMVMATTGIRSGEARALAWRHLLPGGWLFVERAVKMGGTLGTTKTKDQRVIALPQRTQTQLAKWKKETPFKEPEHLIFYGLAADRPLDVETPTHWFPGALERAGIVTEGRNLVPHSLRHTYNTIMRHVLPEEILRRFTGHRTVEMTDWYDHAVMRDRIAKLEPSRALVEGVWK
ncbi:MAG: tyrosine-type recombinase/integrase [Spirochaetia bacterium]|jgi:integrase